MTDGAEPDGASTGLRYNSSFNLAKTSLVTALHRLSAAKLEHAQIRDLEFCM
jgi:hypothetical protein